MFSCFLPELTWLGAASQSQCAWRRGQTETMLGVLVFASVLGATVTRVETSRDAERHLLGDLRSVLKQGQRLTYRLNSAVLAIENQTDILDLDTINSAVRAAIGENIEALNHL